ncbi:hypothetical protein BCR33DRAFT_719778 [Rhizoclosmatium globosum]|uniref:Uncharacterized protein n=1 Tax=Rhizoclosmatium globosum TaxID=329046 RepID=A0A1Y2BYY2_9FUNG|nr:hypothetical protein BCR33DRAFT_719778 [Rhizoclosmatium globosum]|eukprot:ORY39978.1 hypothetical protein BCR33DRAFT_719778 [Rhizoclosmatium globosum]
MTRPHKAKTTAANEGQRNRIAPMNTNDSDENGDRRPSTELRTQFDVPPMLWFETRVWDLVAGITATQDWLESPFCFFFQRFGTFFYHNDLDAAAVEVQSGEHFGFKQFGYQVFYVKWKNNNKCCTIPTYVGIQLTKKRAFKALLFYLTFILVLLLFHSQSLK